MLRMKDVFSLHEQTIFNIERFCPLLKFYAGQNYVQNIKNQLNVKESGNIQQHCFVDGKYLVFDDQLTHILVDKTTNDKLKWTIHADLLRLGCRPEEDSVLLSSDYNNWKFAIRNLSISKETKAQVELKLAGRIIPFRTSLFTLSPAESTAASKALALLRWNKEFNFCCTCGEKLIAVPSKTQKKCASCNKSHYPTINPVGITLIKSGDNNKILLVRQHVHPPGLYTCVAGFIETGETVEENVRREVAEEVGINVKEIKYFASQPWAFPLNSLMIGCTAIAEDEKVSLDYEELEDAKWFTRDEVKTAIHNVKEKNKGEPLKLNGPWIPPPGALAHTLITKWLEMKEQ